MFSFFIPFEFEQQNFYFKIIAMAPPVKSTVWNFFIKSDNGGECKLCHMFVKTKNNTTNLQTHLKRHHRSALDGGHTSRSVSTSSQQDMRVSSSLPFFHKFKSMSFDKNWFTLLILLLTVDFNLFFFCFFRSTTR